MGRDDWRRPSGLPTSEPPETSEIDASWDALTSLDEDDDISFGDRVTAIPDVPFSELAADLMAGIESNPFVGAPEPAPVPGAEPGPTVKESLRTAGVPEFDFSGMDRESDPGSPHSYRGAWQEGPVVTGDTLAGLGESLFDLDQRAARDELPTLDISGDDFGARVDELGSDIGPPSSGLDSLNLDLEDLGAAVTEPPRTRAQPAAPPTVRRIPVERAPLRRKTGLELASDPPPASATPEQAAHQDLHDRFAVGDFSGALIIAESLLEQDPEDLEAKRFAQSCREVLMQMYASRLGSLDGVPSVALPPEQIRWLSLDHRAGFLLSLVDGVSTMDEILDICGMPRLDALRILYMLHEQRVIVVGS